jgi:hypothetical protein
MTNTLLNSKIKDVIKGSTSELIEDGSQRVEDAEYLKTYIICYINY